MAEAVSDVERVGQLNRGLKAAQTDLRKSRSTLRIRRKDVEKIEEKLSEFEGLEEVGTNLAVLAELENRVRSTTENLTVLQGLSTKRVRLLEVKDRLEGVQDIILPAPKVGERAGKAQLLLKMVGGYQQRRTTAQDVVNRLSGAPLDLVPSSASVTAIKQVQTTLQWLRSTKARRGADQKLLDAWAGRSPEDVLANVSEVQTKAVQEERAALQGILTRREQAQAQVVSLGTALEEATDQWEAAKHEVHTILGTRGDCPVCGQEVQA